MGFTSFMPKHYYGQRTGLDYCYSLFHYSGTAGRDDGGSSELMV